MSLLLVLILRVNQASKKALHINRPLSKKWQRWWEWCYKYIKTL